MTYRYSAIILLSLNMYLSPKIDVNLNVIDQYKNAFQDAIIGYSGHELGFLPTLGAVAKGAKVIERHFTLDKSMKGSDHQCSLNPQEFQEMVKSIRSLEQSLGCPQKRFLECEKSCFLKLGKSVVAGRKLSKGEALKLEDLKIKVRLLFDPFYGRVYSIFADFGSTFWVFLTAMYTNFKHRYLNVSK